MILLRVEIVSGCIFAIILIVNDGSSHNDVQSPSIPAYYEGDGRQNERNRSAY